MTAASKVEMERGPFVPTLVVQYGIRTVPKDLPPSPTGTLTVPGWIVAGEGFGAPALLSG